MTAKGKITVKYMAKGKTRVLVTDNPTGGEASADALAGRLAEDTPLYPATRRTKVLAATVLDLEGYSSSHRNGRNRYCIVTDLGRLAHSYPAHQTFTLAPEPATTAPTQPAAKSTGGKKYGDMTPEEKAAARSKAVDQLNKELNHPAMRAAFAAELPAPAPVFSYETSTNRGVTWSTVAAGLGADDCDTIRGRRTDGVEGVDFRFTGADGQPATATNTDPWKDMAS